MLNELKRELDKEYFLSILDHKGGFIINQSIHPPILQMRLSESLRPRDGKDVVRGDKVDEVSSFP